VTSSLSLRRTRAHTKRLERLHILATLDAHGKIYGTEVVAIANSECAHDALDALPELANRGITAKLNSLSLDGLTRGAWPGDGTPMKWEITNSGRAFLRKGLAALGDQDAL
jgi:hypothetical protein